ncbi:MAG: HAD-IC family P-type ATPase, partial [Methylocystaceae bacterium]
IEKMHRMGLTSWMLTGDNINAAAKVASTIEVDQFWPGLLPEDKSVLINNGILNGKRIAMVGDGVNDAPALAQATVGIAMGVAGTDAALETADITLMADDLSRLPRVIGLGRRTVRIIKQNITLAVLIKFAIFLLVVPGWLTMWLAVAADMGSSLLVTLNGLRLLYCSDE